MARHPGACSLGWGKVVANASTPRAWDARAASSLVLQQKCFLIPFRKPHSFSRGRGQRPPLVLLRDREQSKAQPHLAGICTSASLTPYPYKKVYTIHPEGLCCVWFQTLEDRPRANLSSQYGYILKVESISIRGRRAPNFHCHHHLNLTFEDKLVSSSPGEFKIELCFLLNFQLWDKHPLFK